MPGGRKSVSRAKRAAVYKRDKLVCYLCGLKVVVREYPVGSPVPPDTATIDHVIPLVSGGTKKKSNLRTCCYRCNTDKGDRCVRQVRLTQAQQRLFQMAEVRAGQCSTASFTG